MDDAPGTGHVRSQPSIPCPDLYPERVAPPLRLPVLRRDDGERDRGVRGCVGISRRWRRKPCCPLRWGSTTPRSGVCRRSPAISTPRSPSRSTLYRRSTSVAGCAPARTDRPCASTRTARRESPCAEARSSPRAEWATGWSPRPLGAGCTAAPPKRSRRISGGMLGRLVKGLPAVWITKTTRKS